MTTPSLSSPLTPHIIGDHTTFTTHPFILSTTIHPTIAEALSIIIAILFYIIFTLYAFSTLYITIYYLYLIYFLGTCTYLKDT